MSWRSIGLSVGAATLACAVLATSSLAGTAPVTANVLAGTLSLSSSAAPSVSVTLNGSDQD
ncbi:MAG: hypothetical protein ACRDNY_02290, partial [Gaiellaceae bacterium]